jgi:hypothetical protein
MKPIIQSSQSFALNRLLEDPALAGKIQSLSAPVLAELLQTTGLEDAGEIIALATTQQLCDVMDMDVWRNSIAGEDAFFDADRFLLWLEILLEAGESALVKRLAELPEDLIIMAFYSHILVLNLDDMATEMAGVQQDTRDLTEKVLESALGIEIGPYFIIARKHDGWDTLCAAVTALDDSAPDLLEKILSRCCYTSWEYIADNGGLYEVLTAEEMLASDAAADRADRRAAKGYVAPSDATAFLKLALQTPTEGLLHNSEPDPITLAYRREWSGAQKRAVRKRGASPPVNEVASPPANGFETALAALEPLLGADGEEGMQSILYLANIVVSGLGTSDAPIRPADALRAAMDVCGVGYDLLEAEAKPADAGDPLRGTSVENLFMAGWKTLAKGRVLDSLSALENALKNRGK